jgi:lipoyl(octanoyl) transferase
VIVRRLGLVDYEPTWRAMQRFTAERGEDTADEIWLLQHPPVFTLGLAGRPEHLLRDIGVPVVKIDRGGQITYHGPGQWVAYLLLDLRRRQFKVRDLVNRMEQAAVDLLADYGVAGHRREGAPGVYVGEAKIAALGLRVKNGCSYHGIAFNVAMDLAPFGAINPCGYEGLAVTQLADLVADCEPAEVGERLLEHLRKNLE